MGIMPAIGGIAMGGIAMGGMAIGGMAIGGMAIGGMAIGGDALIISWGAAEPPPALCCRCQAGANTARGDLCSADDWSARRVKRCRRGAGSWL